MVRKTTLTEAEVDDLIEDYKRGVSVAKLCKAYKVGRGRCVALLMRDVERDRDEVVGAWESAQGERPNEPEPTRWRTSQHFMVAEPPAPLQTKLTIPVLAADQKKTKEGSAAKEARKAAAEEGAALEEAVSTLNRALAAIDLGSDDQNLVDEGLEALKEATRGGAVTPAKARELRRDLKRARHEAAAAKQAAPAAEAASQGWGAADMMGAAAVAAVVAPKRASRSHERADNVAVQATPPAPAPTPAPKPADPAAALAAYRGALRFAD